MAALKPTFSISRRHFFAPQAPAEASQRRMALKSAGGIAGN
jgi:hypothetical protein